MGDQIDPVRLANPRLQATSRSGAGGRDERAAHEIVSSGRKRPGQRKRAMSLMGGSREVSAMKSPPTRKEYNHQLPSSTTKGSSTFGSSAPQFQKKIEEDSIDRAAKAAKNLPHQTPERHSTRPFSVSPDVNHGLVIRPEDTKRKRPTRVTLAEQKEVLKHIQPSAKVVNGVLSEEQRYDVAKWLFQGEFRFLGEIRKRAQRTDKAQSTEVKADEIDQIPLPAANTTSLGTKDVESSDAAQESTKISNADMERPEQKVFTKEKIHEHYTSPKWDNGHAPREATGSNRHPLGVIFNDRTKPTSDNATLMGKRGLLPTEAATGKLASVYQVSTLPSIVVSNREANRDPQQTEIKGEQERAVLVPKITGDREQLPQLKRSTEEKAKAALVLNGNDKRKSFIQEKTAVAGSAISLQPPFITTVRRYQRANEARDTRSDVVADLQMSQKSVEDDGSDMGCSKQNEPSALQRPGAKRKLQREPSPPRKKVKELEPGFNPPSEPRLMRLPSYKRATKIADIPTSLPGSGSKQGVLSGRKPAGPVMVELSPQKGPNWTISERYRAAQAEAESLATARGQKWSTSNPSSPSKAMSPLPARMQAMMISSPSPARPMGFASVAPPSTPMQAPAQRPPLTPKEMADAFLEELGEELQLEARTRIVTQAVPGPPRPVAMPQMPHWMPAPMLAAPQAMALQSPAPMWMMGVVPGAILPRAPDLSAGFVPGVHVKPQLLAQFAAPAYYPAGVLPSPPVPSVLNNQALDSLAADIQRYAEDVQRWDTEVGTKTEEELHFEHTVSLGLGEMLAKRMETALMNSHALNQAVRQMSDALHATIPVLHERTKMYFSGAASQTEQQKEQEGEPQAEEQDEMEL